MLAAFLSAIIAGIMVNYVDETINYFIWSSLHITFSFLICILHPGKAWYVPIVCNALVILPAACDNSFWNTSFGLIIGSGIVLSVLMAHLGGLIGKRRTRDLLA
jgi:hypothetical protein